MSARKSISNSFTVNTVEDGESAPYYFQEWFAWSNDASTSSVTTAPTIAGSWATSIPAQGSYAYLWRKSIRYVWNENTRQYSGETAQYVRMTGTNGTSIAVKGHVATTSNLPTTHNDGDAYVVDADGHLYMWSDEANQWLDIGQFQGEKGKTYYTHIAWATNVIYSGSTVTSVEGFVTVKSPNDTTHIWMGVYIDEQSGQDSANALLYTWSNTKGDKGNDAVTYDIVFSEAWARVSEEGIITARLKGIAYKITGSNHVPQAGVTIRYGYILNDSGTYVHTTALSDGSFDTGNWFNGDRIEGAAKNSQNIFAAIIINNTVMCTKYVTIAKQGDTGARGKIGRFFYFGGEFNSEDESQTFIVNDAQAPYFEHTETVTTQSGTTTVKRYHVFNYDTNGTYTMSQMWAISSNWNNKPWEAMTNDFKYIITEALFGAYAHLGSWIFNGDYMLSEKDANGNPRGQREYNGMGDSQLTSGFIPSIAFDAFNGRASLGGDKVRFNPNGSGWLANGNISWDANGNASYSGSFDAVSSQNGGWRINRYTDALSIPTIEGVNIGGNTVFKLMFDSDTSDSIYPHDYGGLYISNSGDFNNPDAEYAREAWLISFRDNTDIYMTAWVGNQYPYIHGVALNNKDFYIGVKDYGLWLQASQWPQLSNVANNQVFVDDYGLVRVKGYNDTFIPQGSSQTSGTVTWVNVGTGLTSSTGGAITTSGTISISSTYQTYISNGNTAYGWGNHANAGYAKTSQLSNYLPLTGGTITGNLSVKGTLTASDGNLDIYSAGNQGGNATYFEFTDSQDVYFDGSPFYDFIDGALWAVSFNQRSDLRRKNIIGDVSMNLYNVANAPLFKFTWKDEKKYSGQHIGSAAQYWQTILPELVSIGHDADMTLAMQYDVIALASAIAVAKTVVGHEERIKVLENENKSLKEEIELLKNKS